MARASLNELQGQLAVAEDLGYTQGNRDTVANATILGKRISCLINKLHPIRDHISN